MMFLRSPTLWFSTLLLSPFDGVASLVLAAAKGRNFTSGMNDDAATVLMVGHAILWLGVFLLAVVIGAVRFSLSTKVKVKNSQSSDLSKAADDDTPVKSPSRNIKPPARRSPLAKGEVNCEA